MNVYNLHTCCKSKYISSLKMFLSQKDMFSVDVWVSPPPHKICDVLGVGDLIWLVEQNVWNLDSLITTTLLLVHLPAHDESQKKGHSAVHSYSQMKLLSRVGGVRWDSHLIHPPLPHDTILQAFVVAILHMKNSNECNEASLSCAAGRRVIRLTRLLTRSAAWRHKQELHDV